MPKNEANSSQISEQKALDQEKAMAEFNSIMNDVKGILAADSKDAAAVSKANTLLSQAASLDLPQSIINAELAKYPPEIQKAYKIIEQKAQTTTNLDAKVTEARVQFDMATANQIATMSSADLDAFISTPGNADAYTDQIISRIDTFAKQAEKEHEDFMGKDWNSMSATELEKAKKKDITNLCAPINMAGQAALMCDNVENIDKYEKLMDKEAKEKEEKLRKEIEEQKKILNDPNASPEKKAEAAKKMEHLTNLRAEHHKTYTRMKQRVKGHRENVTRNQPKGVTLPTRTQTRLPSNKKNKETSQNDPAGRAKTQEAEIAALRKQLEKTTNPEQRRQLEQEIYVAETMVAVEQKKAEELEKDMNDFYDVHAALGKGDNQAVQSILARNGNTEEHAKAQIVSEEIALVDKQYQEIKDTINSRYKALTGQDLDQEATQKAQQEGELPVRNTRVSLADASLDAQPKEAIQEMQQEGELPVRKGTRLDLATVSLDSQSQEATQKAQQEGELPVRKSTRMDVASVSLDTQPKELAQENTATGNDVSAPVTPQDKAADNKVAANENSSESSEIRLTERVAQNAVAVEVNKEQDVDYAQASRMAMQAEGR